MQKIDFFRNNPTIAHALTFATISHGDQVRKYTGRPYIEHPIEVACLVAEHGGSDKMVMAALLHDVLEDTEADLEQIRIRFGYGVGELVAELTEPKIEGNRKFRKEKECNRLASITSEAQSIKCADIISNTRSIVEYDKPFARVYLREKAAILAVLMKAKPSLKNLALRTLQKAQTQLVQEAIV